MSDANTEPQGPDTTEHAHDPEVLQLAAKVFDLARHGDTSTLAAYVDAGVPATLTNDKGDSLVMLAAYHGHADTVAALLERGADPDRPNDRGQTPWPAPSSRARTRSYASWWPTAPTRPRGRRRRWTRRGCSRRGSCWGCSGRSEGGGGGGGAA